MNDPRISDAKDDVRAIKRRLTTEIARFQAMPDAEIAQFGVGGDGGLETHAMVARIAANMKQSQAAILGARIATLDNYMTALGQESVTEATLAIVQTFIDAWDDAERDIERLGYVGCPDVEPPALDSDGSIAAPSQLGLSIQDMPGFAPASGQIPEQATVDVPDQPVVQMTPPPPGP